jgi:aminoglycoside phosphotransferase (APT) family kinase protein
MLLSDPKMPDLELAWSAPRILDLFNQEILPAGLPGQRASAVKIGKKIGYAPGRECVVPYELKFEGKDKGQAVATFVPDLGALEDIHADNAPGAVLLRDRQCLIEFFPHDWCMPSLPQAMDAAAMTPRLADALSLDGAWTGECEVARYRPHMRCTLRYRLTPADGDRRVVLYVKVYADHEPAGRIADSQADVRAQAEALGLYIPRPAAVFEDLNIVVMKEVAGRSMTQLLDGGPAQSRHVTRVAAATMATYHGLTLGTDNARTLPGEIERWRKRVPEVALIAPEFADSVHALLDRIERSADHSDQPALRLIHGDAKPTHLMMDGDNVGIIDFDRACLGDPALDVGAFVAHFRKFDMRKKSGARGPLTTLFLRDYQARSRSKGLIRRAHLFESLTLIRMASRQLLRAPYKYAKKGVASRPSRLLDEALKCLEDQ